MRKKRENTLLDPGTITQIETDAKDKSISKSAVIRQIVEAHYKGKVDKFVNR